MTVQLNLPGSSATCASLIARARTQEANAWNELIDLYGPLIAHWCYRCNLDSHSVADCVQDVFAAVASSLDTYQSTKDSGGFRSWLWTITSNKIKDFFRRNRHRVAASGGSSAFARLQLIPDAISESIPEDEPSSEIQLHELVARGLNQVRAEFKPRTWQIFERTVIDQLPTASVAAEFGIQASAVRQIRSRVLRRLRLQLGDLDE
jgi:RNA polymerase sigma-70 factor (ECF subfamily)